MKNILGFSRFAKIYQLFSILSLALLCYFCYLMFEIMFNYVPFHTKAGFLIVKQKWVQYDWWLFAFKIHVFSSIFVLFAGFSQFFKWFQSATYRQWHRYLGYVYVVAVLGFAMPSGFVLAVTALGGWIVQTSFIVLCALWSYTTIMAVITARQKQFERHRVFMVYSYALSLSAVTLRFLKLGLYDLAPYFSWLTPMTIYRVESVLAWVLNLLLAWVWLKFLNSRHKNLQHRHLQK